MEERPFPPPRGAACHLGLNTVLKIELAVTNLASPSDGLVITAGNRRVRGLVLNRFDRFAIRLQGGDGSNVVDRNFLGPDVSGATESTTDGVGRKSAELASRSWLAVVIQQGRLLSPSGGAPQSTPRSKRRPP